MTSSYQLTVHTWPTSLHVAQAAFCDVTVENQTSEIWDPEDSNPVQIAYHWVNDQGGIVVYDGLRTRLPRTIAPGERLRLAARIHPPTIPGRYRLVIDLLREHVRWFNVDQEAQVEIRPAPQRRATLVVNNVLMGDAVGNNVVRKLDLLRQWGFAPLILTEFVDERLSVSDQVHIAEVSTQTVLSPDQNHEWIMEHFRQSDLYLFEYPIYYPLVELIRVVPHGPVIFDYHGVTPPTLWMGAEDRRGLEQGLKKLTLVAYADYAIAHSDYTRQELLNTGVIDPERVSVMHYGVPIDRFRPTEASDVPAELQNAEGPVLLYVGRMAGNKRIDTLIRMVARVREQYPNMRLLLVGDNLSPAYQPVVKHAQELIAMLELEDNVIFVGPKRPDELPPYYNACDIYVTSSLHEGFCVPVVEAMACGKPVVATNATALPSTIGEAGLLFEPEDDDEFAARVLSLLDSKYLRANGYVNASNEARSEGARRGGN